MNFLIIGSDSRELRSTTRPTTRRSATRTPRTRPPRSDTMMVLHANGDHSFAVSFPRDLWVDIPGKGNAKINAAFNDGPAEGRRHAAVRLQRADQPLPRGRLRDLRGDRRRDRHGARVDPRASSATTSPGCHAVLGAGCYQLDGADRARNASAPGNLEILDPNGKYDPETGQRWSCSTPPPTSAGSSASRTS